MIKNYGKIIDGILIHPNNPIHYKEYNVFNPSSEILLELGWLWIEYTTPLPSKDGYTVECSYTEVEEQEIENETGELETIPRHIKQEWHHEEIPKVEPTEYELEQQAINRFSKMLVNTIELTDEQAISVKVLFKKWDEYEDGTDMTDGTNDTVLMRVLYKDILYKVIKTHKKQSDWTPDTASSLFTPIGFPDAGTIDNPITWVDGMESETGKYYTDEGVLYIAIEDSGVGLYGKPKDLARYFKVVE